MKILSGHTSPETAYLIEDYPCGFTARCKKRMWVETKKGFGQRVVSQTTDKHGNWCKPKAGTYNLISIIYLNEENNHVEVDGYYGNGHYSDAERFFERIGTKGLQALDQIQANTLIYELALGRAKAKHNPPYLKSEWAALGEERTKELKAQLEATFKEQKEFLHSLRNEVKTNA